MANINPLTFSFKMIHRKFCTFIKSSHPKDYLQIQNKLKKNAILAWDSQELVFKHAVFDIQNLKFSLNNELTFSFRGGKIADFD